MEKGRTYSHNILWHCIFLLSQNNNELRLTQSKRWIYWDNSKLIIRIQGKYKLSQVLWARRPSLPVFNNFCFFSSELRQRNALPKVESPGAPLQRTISEPTLGESPSQSNQSRDSNKINQEAIEPRKSNSLLNISSSSAGKTCAYITVDAI